MLVIEVGPGDIPADQLTCCQRDAAAGLYAQAMAAFLTWLAPRFGEVQSRLRAEIETLREQARTSDSHRRTPEIVANLAVGLKYFLRFALDAEAVTEKEAEEWFKWGWKVIGAAAGAQSRYQEDNEPTRRFRHLLAAALGSGKAHAAGRDGGEPESPAAWGWREFWVGGGENQTPEWRAQGDRIGFLDGDSLYLLPDAAYQAAQKMASESGDGISVKPPTLARRLRERGLLVTTEAGRERLTVRVTICGVRQKVWHLRAGAILPQEPSQPSQSDLDDAG